MATRCGDSGRWRARGLKRRIEDLLTGEEDAAALDDVLRSAGILPGEGWRQRIADGEARGAAEAFLAAVRGQVYARATGVDGPFDIECDLGEPGPELLEAAANLADGLSRLSRPLKALRESLLARLDDEADSLETATRQRIESMVRSLQYRGEDVVLAWRNMLDRLQPKPPNASLTGLAYNDMRGATSMSACKGTGSTQPSRLPRWSSAELMAWW